MLSMVMLMSTGSKPPIVNPFERLPVYLTGNLAMLALKGYIESNIMYIHIYLFTVHALGYSYLLVALSHALNAFTMAARVRLMTMNVVTQSSESAYPSAAITTKHKIIPH